MRFRESVNGPVSESQIDGCVYKRIVYEYYAKENEKKIISKGNKSQFTYEHAQRTPDPNQVKWFKNQINLSTQCVNTCLCAVWS